MLCIVGRNFCFAVAVNGRRTYNLDASNGVAPILLVLLLCIAPASAIAGNIHRMGCSAIIGALDIIIAILLFIAGVGTLAMTAEVGGLAATLWAQLLPSQQKLTYGGNAASLETEMRDDMAAVGIVSLVGAVSTIVPVYATTYPMGIARRSSS